MLIPHVERYLALRNATGATLRQTSRRLREFARFAEASGDTHINTSTAVRWSEAASTPGSRYRRLVDVIRLGMFLHAEDPDHDIPPRHVFASHRTRKTPYIYTADEQARILNAANQLRVARHSYPLRRQTYVTLFGLLAATGMRVSEALNLKLGDLMPSGVVRIRNSKFGKSRLLPLHPTVVDQLYSYLKVRGRVATDSEHVFLSAHGRAISHGTANSTFRRVLLLAGIVPRNDRWPRIHDLRHTFATRALEQCATRNEEFARHAVALSTYLGHVDIVSTYWYLQATPELMVGMAGAAEAVMAKEGV